MEVKRSGVVTVILGASGFTGVCDQEQKPKKNKQIILIERIKPLKVLCILKDHYFKG